MLSNADIDENSGDMSIVISNFHITRMMVMLIAEVVHKNMIADLGESPESLHLEQKNPWILTADTQIAVTAVSSPL